jgi:hypothetical protein
MCPPDALHNKFVAAIITAAWANELPEDYLSYIPVPRPKRERPKLWVKTNEAPKKKRLVAPAQIKVEPVGSQAEAKKAEVLIKAKPNAALVPLDLSIPSVFDEQAPVPTPPSKIAVSLVAIH